jgi:hypothetical protein
MKRLTSFLTSVAFLFLFTVAAPLAIGNSIAVAQGFPSSKVQACLSAFECWCLNTQCDPIDFPEYGCCCFVCPPGG